MHLMTVITPASAADSGRTIRPIERLRYDAGSLSMNLVATLGRRRSDQPVERLWDPDRLTEWLDAVGLRAEGQRWPVTAQHLALLRELREAIYRVALNMVAQPTQQPSRRDIDLINAYTEGPFHPVKLQWTDPKTGHGGPVRVRTSQPGIEAAFAAIASDAVDTITAGVRLRACDGDLCGMLYIDTSQGARRRWCSMTRCGNQAKAARHRSQPVD
jgi:predicted RNA-binding Zn ribbon-like protein